MRRLDGGKGEVGGVALPMEDIADAHLMLTGALIEEALKADSRARKATEGADAESGDAEDDDA